MTKQGVIGLWMCVASVVLVAVASGGFEGACMGAAMGLGVVGLYLFIDGLG